MEQFQKDLLNDGFAVDEEAKSNFKDIAQWAGINAIVAFISLTINLISAFALLGRTNGGSSLFGTLITAVISLLLNIILFQASTNIKKGVLESEQGFFGLGLNKLAQYFKVYCIIIIICLALFVLALLLALLFNAARG